MNDKQISVDPLVRSALAQFVAGYCGDYYGLEDQIDGESDGDFQRRVASLLRAKGKLIEAHEVARGCRWDNKDGGADVVGGLMGAMAIALNPRAQYGANVSRHVGAITNEEREGERILADEQCAGALVRDSIENPPPSPEAMSLMLSLMEMRR